MIFEEIGGDPTSIQFSRRKISSVCSHISEDHPSFDFEHFQKDGAGDYNNKATVRLKCQKNTQISAVKFASFGNPVGTCGSYAQGECHDPSSISIVKKVKQISEINDVKPVYLLFQCAFFLLIIWISFLN